MMGSRGHYTGDERDAFTRPTRRRHPWPPHGAKKIKKGWWRRLRAKVRIATRKAGASEDDMDFDAELKKVAKPG